MVPGSARAGALAFADGIITAVGDKQAVLAASPGADVIDVGEATVMPGFIDAHHHVSISALYDGAVRLVRPAVRDIASLQETLRRAANASAADRWLVATHLDESLLTERRPPTRQELDDAVPDRPLFVLHHTCHRALANTKALEAAGIGQRTPEPSGGTISRSRGGIPDGLLIERAMAPVEELARADRVRVDAEGTLDRMSAHYRAMLRAGITRVCDTAVPPDLLGLYRALAERGDVLMPTHACPVSLQGWLPEPTDVLEGPCTGERVGRNLVIGPVKLVFDGAPGCSMCLSWAQTLASAGRALGIALRDKSLDSIRTTLTLTPRYGRHIRTGIALYEQADGGSVVRRAVERGFAVASHAIGNAAIDVALSAYSSAGARLNAGGVPRFEHAMFAERGQAQRMADLGIAAVVQPAMIEMHMAASAPRIPGLPMFPLRRLQDAGVMIVGSSDYPVHTFDPLAGIRAATRRQNARGDTIDAEECISLDEAIAAYTRNAARALGVDNETGTIAVGKRADLAVVDGLEDGAPEVRRAFVA